MQTAISLLSAAPVFAKTEPGRILATLVILFVTTGVLKLLQKQARAGHVAALDGERRRRNFVMAKNLTIAVALVLGSSVWASMIAGAALSVAAVAGAMLLVAKEFLANLLGSVMLTIARPYRVGDFIELDQFSGRVLDSDMLVTTIAETQEGHQLTGRTVTLPHSMLLGKPVRNLTATGAYVVNMLTIGLHPSEDLLAHEVALLAAAHEVCGYWLEDANIHLKRKESLDLVDLPSAAPRVIIQMHGSRECTLALRYCCRPNDRVKVEQDVLRRYLVVRPVRLAPPVAGE